MSSYARNVLAEPLKVAHMTPDVRGTQFE